MNWHDELRTAGENAVEAVINSPKLAASVGGATTSLGAAIRMDWVQGTLASGAVLSGIIMTLILARLHWVTVQNRQIEHKILLRQLADLGVEPLTEKSNDT